MRTVATHPALARGTMLGGCHPCNRMGTGLYSATSRLTSIRFMIRDLPTERAAQGCKAYNSSFSISCWLSERLLNGVKKQFHTYSRQWAWRRFDVRSEDTDAKGIAHRDRLRHSHHGPIARRQCRSSQPCRAEVLDNKYQAGASRPEDADPL